MSPFKLIPTDGLQHELTLLWRTAFESRYGEVRVPCIFSYIFG